MKRGNVNVALMSAAVGASDAPYFDIKSSRPVDSRLRNSFARSGKDKVLVPLSQTLLRNRPRGSVIIPIERWKGNSELVVILAVDRSPEHVRNAVQLHRVTAPALPKM
jgi:hypothetical protein